MWIVINAITLSRLLLAISVIWLHSDLYLLGISIWAAFSDFIDGHLSRRLKLDSVFGERLDQLADKVFHLVMLFCLWSFGLSALYFVILFIVREVAIVLLRSTGKSRQTSFNLGKWKTVLSYAYIIYLFAMWCVYHEDQLVLLTRTFEIAILVLAYWSLLLSIKRDPSKR